jgi:SAM-dependent methyltransferase
MNVVDMEHEKISTDEAVRRLRADPQHAALIRDSYLGEDVRESAERFRASAEFADVKGLLGAHIRESKILDLGAGTGIASYALARSGAKIVYALEPDESSQIGRGAINRLGLNLPIKVLNAFGEEIPLPDAEVDIVYARQVLHHAQDLAQVLRECARVLKSGGLFLACREHVIEDEDELKTFLSEHPVHRLAGGENAFPLATYLSAIERAGLKTERIMGPWDTVINAFPEVRTKAELERIPEKVLAHRLGKAGALASHLPGLKSLVWRRVKRSTPPGRMYSFLAVKT